MRENHCEAVFNICVELLNVKRVHLKIKIDKCRKMR